MGRKSGGGGLGKWKVQVHAPLHIRPALSKTEARWHTKISQGPWPSLDLSKKPNPSITCTRSDSHAAAAGEFEGSSEMATQLHRWLRSLLAV